MKSFLEQVAKHYNKQENLHDYAFVFPNKRAGSFFQKALSEIIDKPIFSPSILTLGDLLVKITDLRLEDKYGMLFQLYDIYSKKLEEKGRVVELLDDFMPFGETLLNDFDDIDKYCVDAKQLFTNIKDLKELEDLTYLTENQRNTIYEFWGKLLIDESEKEGSLKQKFSTTFEILADLYYEFREKLEADNKAYEGMLLNKVACKLKNNEDIVLPYKKIVFVGFNALTVAERIIFEKLSAQGKAEFCWDYPNDIVCDEKNRSSFYYKKNSTLKPSFEVEKCTQYPDIEVISTVSDTEQMKQVQNLFVKNKIENPSIETAIVLADEDKLIPVLQSLPKVDKMNITMGYPLKSTPMISLINDIYVLHKNARKDGFYNKDVTKLLSHPYIVQVLAEADITTVINNIKINNRVFILSKALLNGLEECSGGLLQQIFKQPIDEKSETIKSVQLCDYFIRILDIITGMLNVDNDENVHQLMFINSVRRMINRLKMLFEKWQPDLVKEDTVFRIIRQQINSVSIPYEGEPLEGLQVMGMLETRVLDFKNVIITSFNESVFPKKVSNNTYIPYNLRRGYGLPTGEHQDAVFAYHFYRLISRAEKVYLLYNSSTDGLNNGEISRYFSQIKYLYQDKFKNISEKVVVYNVNSSQFEDHVIEKNDVVMDILNKYLIQEGSDKKILSPSSFNKYINCPLEFYLSVIENLSEEDEIAEELDSREIGTVFHEIMFTLYSDYKNKGVLKESDFNDIKNKIDSTITRTYNKTFLHRKEEQYDEPLEGKDKLNETILKIFVEKTINYDKQLEGLQILALEECFNGVFDLNDGRKVNIGGIIDRVDKVGDFYRIVDYKTGNKDIDFKLTESEKKYLFKSDQKAILQTFIYAYIYQQKNPQIKDNQIRMCLYSLPNIIKGDDVNIITEEKDPAITFEKSKSFFEENFRKLLLQFFSKDNHFESSKDENSCKYCNFLTFCNRKKKDF